MKSATMKVGHLYITRKPGVCNGRPIIAGTRTPVKSIVTYHKMGLSTEEIQSELPYLSLAQIYDALSFYYDHIEEIDREIEEDMEENIMKEFGRLSK
jgi:uncharacterized protein (DUF433 family)